MVDRAIAQLTAYAEVTGLIQPGDRVWAVNTILEALRLDSFTAPDPWPDGQADLAPVLDTLLDDAVKRGLTEDSVTFRDLLDTAVMGRLTPRPSQVAERFWQLYHQSPRAATDWYYRFSQDTNYIRRDRMAKDMKWVTGTAYGDIDITINLAKPEKDPRAIAAAGKVRSTAYPSCQLCVENEGYPGRPDHPARSNHRVVPITIAGSPWYLQYSPYVYYNEHCIALNAEHTPMRIDRACFAKLLDFVGQFPHYFVGSNADLPIVGGSILSHDHFQGGHYAFAMERAPVERPVTFPDYPGVTGGIVKWPMSVLRIASPDPERLVDLADRVLTRWRGYTDEAAFIFAETEGTPHNTITPIARMRQGVYELDLVLRNNITTEEYPLGVYHPHQEHHHIKRENIGLIEVMGLAVLPARLKDELSAVARGLCSGADLRADELTAGHADWAETFSGKYSFSSPDGAMEAVKRETGLVFAEILEQAGVYKRTEAGQGAFLRFIEQI